MNKRKIRVATEDLVLELLNSNTAIEAHLMTLFMMQCQLFDRLEKSNQAESVRTVENWGKVRMDFLKQNLAAINDRITELAKASEQPSKSF